MLDDKDYCDYDTCVALREIGCRIKTEWYIHQPSYERGSCYLCFGIPQETSILDECDYIPRLSLYEVQKFLRKNKRVEVNSCYDKGNDKWFYYVLFMDYPDLMGITVSESKYDSYEEALLEGIKQIIEILKNETEKIN